MSTEEKGSNLVVIHTSLPAIPEEAILWAAGVPDADAAVITGTTTSSLGKPWGNSPKS